MNDKNAPVYDDPHFFSQYLQLRAKQITFNSAIEQPAIMALLPADIRGRALDIGCGFGELTGYLRRRGAESVLGIDPSTLMLEEARKRNAEFDGIDFIVTSAEDFGFSHGPFDLVVSSLAFHYVRDFKGTIDRIGRSMSAGARLVFSVEHPICTSIGLNQWHIGTDGRNEVWPVDRYQDEGPRHSQWLDTEVVKYHRTTATYVNTLLSAGFRLAALLEPAPDPAFIEAQPNLSDQNRRPPFLVIAAER